MKAGSRDVERLEDRLTEWTEDGSLPPDAAAAIAAVLATAANEANDEGWTAGIERTPPRHGFEPKSPAGGTPPLLRPDVALKSLQK